MPEIALILRRLANLFKNTYELRRDNELLATQMARFIGAGDQSRAYALLRESSRIFQATVPSLNALVYTLGNIRAATPDGAFELRKELERTHALRQVLDTDLHLRIDKYLGGR